MPSTSDKQRRFMAAAAHNPKFAKRAGIKQGVAKEFNRADTRKKYQSGGLATVAKNYFNRQPNPGAIMRPNPGAMVNPMLRRPPPQGGLAQANFRGGNFGKPNPMGFPGQQPPPFGGATTNPVTGPGGSPYQPRPPQMLPGPGGMPPRPGGPPMPPGIMPGGPRPGGPMRPPGGMPGGPGMRPGMGGLAQYGAARGFPGPAGGPQRPGGGLPGYPGRSPGPGGINGLLRTAGNASGQYGQRLNHMMGRMPGGRPAFAGGGRISKKSNA